jgi:hypothetical protein
MFTSRFAMSFAKRIPFSEADFSDSRIAYVLHLHKARRGYHDFEGNPVGLTHRDKGQ